MDLTVVLQGEVRLGSADGPELFGYPEDMLPTRTMDDTHFIFEFARSDTAAYLNPRVEYGPDMETWKPAVNGQDGVVIEVEDDGFGTDAHGAGIDKVTVKIPHGGETRMFCQLVVED